MRSLPFVMYVLWEWGTSPTSYLFVRSHRLQRLRAPTLVGAQPQREFTIRSRAFMRYALSGDKNCIPGRLVAPLFEWQTYGPDLIRHALHVIPLCKVSRLFTGPICVSSTTSEMPLFYTPWAQQAANTIQGH